MINTERDIHLSLLTALEKVHDRYYEITAPAERISLLLNTCSKAVSGMDPVIGNNLQRIIGHYMQTASVDYEWLIGFLLGRINNPIDRKMMERENRDDFDGKYQTLTSVILSQYELPEEVSVERYEGANRYNPSPVVAVKIALAKLAKYGVSFSDFVFIDVGSGMGRVLLQAADHPFHKIIGIELSAHLHNIALSNIAVYQPPEMQCHDITSQCVNALEFDFPEKDMVLYFWLPFDENIAVAFFNRLESFAKQHQVRIILIFLEVYYECVGKSTFFSKKEAFQVPVTTVNEHSFFSMTIFSNF